MKEIWRFIPGWGDLYSVSDQGRVRSNGRVIVVKDPKGRRAKRRFKKRILNTMSGKYPHVTFTFPGIKRTIYNVHDLVTRVFLGPKPKGLEVCHNNGNPRDCRLKNLRYDTRSANSHDRKKHGTMIIEKGIDSPNAKLNEASVFKIRVLRGMFTQRELAKQFKVTHSTIGAVQRRERY